MGLGAIPQAAPESGLLLDWRPACAPGVRGGSIIWRGVRTAVGVRMTVVHRHANSAVTRSNAHMHRLAAHQAKHHHRPWPRLVSATRKLYVGPGVQGRIREGMREKVRACHCRAPGPGTRHPTARAAPNKSRGPRTRAQSSRPTLCRLVDETRSYVHILAAAEVVRGLMDST